MAGPLLVLLPSMHVFWNPKSVCNTEKNIYNEKYICGHKIFSILQHATQLKDKIFRDYLVTGLYMSLYVFFLSLTCMTDSVINWYRSKT